MSLVAPAVAMRAEAVEAEAEGRPVEADCLVLGSIVDSWVEPAGRCDWDARLVLQVAPRGRPRELVILEAEATLVPDLDWLADLGENLCHGSPVWYRATPTRSGAMRVMELVLAR